MKARSVVGWMLILIGAGAIYLGVRGWTGTRELIDESAIELAVEERETSPLMAALGAIALVTGLVTLRTSRDRTPI